MYCERKKKSLSMVILRATSNVTKIKEKEIRERNDRSHVHKKEKRRRK
jgi:hypothetical protein